MTTPKDRDSEPKSGGSRKSQVIAGIVTIVTLVFVFFGVLPRFADYSDAWVAIQGMTTLSIALLIVVTIANIIVYVWPFQAALPGIGFGSAFAVRQTSFAISNAVPAGGAFGLGVQYGMLSDYGYGPGPAAAAIGITSLWNILVTLGLPVLSIIGLTIAGVQIESWAVIAGWVGLAVVVVSIVVLVLVFRSETMAVRIGSFLDRIVTWIARLFRRTVDADLSTKVIEFRQSTVDVVRSHVGMITFTNVLQQLMQFFVLFVALRGIEVDATTQVTLLQAFAAYSVGRLGTFIPLTPGGVGTVDAVMVAALVNFGASEADALAATLVWRAATYFPQLFIGIGTFLQWRGRKTLKTG